MIIIKIIIIWEAVEISVVVDVVVVAVVAVGVVVVFGMVTEASVFIISIQCTPVTPTTLSMETSAAVVNLILPLLLLFRNIISIITVNIIIFIIFVYNYKSY